MEVIYGTQAMMLTIWKKSILNLLNLPGNLLITENNDILYYDAHKLPNLFIWEAGRHFNLHRDEVQLC